MAVYDRNRRPVRFFFLRAVFAWLIAYPLLLITSRSYAMGAYHAAWWSAGGAVVLTAIATLAGLPFGRCFGTFWKRFQLSALTWGMPLYLALHCAFDLPARYAEGSVVTQAVNYHVWGSRQCVVNLAYFDSIADRSIRTCVGRDAVGEVPGDSRGEVTVKATPYGIQLLSFQSLDPDKRDERGRPRLSGR